MFTKCTRSYRSDSYPMQLIMRWIHHRWRNSCWEGTFHVFLFYGVIHGGFYFLRVISCILAHACMRKGLRSKTQSLYTFLVINRKYWAYSTTYLNQKGCLSLFYLGSKKPAGLCNVAEYKLWINGIKWVRKIILIDSEKSCIYINLLLQTTPIQPLVSHIPLKAKLIERTPK